MFVTCNYVPDSFGLGIIIPILKDSSGCNFKKIEDFRCITISPVISKVFEMVLYKVIGESYMFSSNHQFGYKKGYGCSHAIYTVRKTIEYFTTNNSTVNFLCNDILRAFDRLNQNKLFLKLAE